MNARGDNPLHVMVVAASSERRSVLMTLLGRDLELRTSAGAGISLERILQTAVEAVLVDVDSPALSSAVIRAAEALPDGIGFITLVDNPEPQWVTASLGAGINAILAREVTAEELRLAVQAAEAGLILLHPSSAHGLHSRGLAADHDSPVALVESLTAREQEVLRLVSDGLGNKEIAGRLRISEHTVKFHISSILGKLGAASRTEAVSQGIRKGFIVI